MTLIELHLFGPLRIAAPDGRPVMGVSRRAQGLLVYLACQDGMRAERSGIADLLWSDRDEAQARASLRQELSVLRRVLGAVVEADRQGIWLIPGAVSVRRDGSGDFLAGFDLPSEAFEDWLREERQRVARPAASARAAPESLRPTLSIMPFEELGAAESDMFADSVVEEITSAISRNRSLDVIARQSSFALRGMNLTAPDAAERLGANYLLEGSVRRAGERVRISVQLVRGSDGHVLWTERFNDRIDDLFDLQDRIAAQVAGQVFPSLRAAEIAQARTRPSADRTAYELVLSALPHFWAHQAEENRRAIELLSRALEHSPNYAPAMAYKAWCHSQQCCYLWTHDGAADRQAARDLVARATPLAQDDPASLVALSAASSLALDDFELSQAYVTRALTLDPNNAWGWMRRAWTAIYRGEIDAALTAVDRFEHLSPLDPFHFNGLFARAGALRAAKRFDEAIPLIEQGLREGTGVTWAYRMLFGTHWLAGNREAAMEAAEKWRCAHPQLTWKDVQSLLPKWRHDPDYMDALSQLWNRE